MIQPFSKLFRCILLPLLLLGLLPGATQVTATPGIIPDGSLGTCYAFYTTNGTALSPYAYAAGSRWDRFDFRWNMIEGTPGVFKFGPHDNIVNLDRAHGLNIVGILGSTAAWATTDCAVRHATPFSMPPGHPLRMAQFDNYWWRHCPPDNLDLPWDDPENYWGNYVYQTVSHFKGRVDVWEIWNEPDLGTTYWSGSPAQYAQLLKVGYQAVKAANPEATVLFAGLAYWSDPTYYIQVLDVLTTLEGAAAHNYYFDVLSLHLYSSVYHIAPIAAEIQANMRSRVGAHPIWLTETGVPLWDEHPTNPGVPYSYTATITEAAAYVIQAYAGARTVGIEKFFFFRMHDEYMHENFGLLRNDLTARPAYASYQVAAQYLHGENQVSGPFGNTVRRITFYGTPRGRIDVLWNMTGASLTTTQPALLPQAKVIDMYGNVQTLAAQSGNFTLPLAPATANTGYNGSFIIGGPPVLLLQEDTEPPQLQLQPLPTAVSLPATLTVTWNVTETLSGYWYAEIDRAPTPTGPWTRVAGWAETNGITATTLALTEPGTWYLRARARDRAGNWQTWDAASRTAIAAIHTRPVQLLVSLFSDTNSNGVWDADEATPPGPVALTWQTAAGELLTHTTFTAPTGTLYLGIAWRVSATVHPGDYLLTAAAADHLLRRAPFTVEPAPEPLRLATELALLPVRGRVFLPVITRQ